MTIGSINFDQITEAHLMALKDNQVPEGLTLEYKSESYRISDEKSGEDKNREALKDISAFANASGGDLLLGVTENQGIIVDIPGLDIDADDEITRMTNLLRDGIEPRIIPQIRSVKLANGKRVIAVRVAKSWAPPHRVRRGNANRFYVRNPSGVHEASVDELRRLFTAAADVNAQIRNLRDERLSAIQTNAAPIDLKPGPKHVVHVIPMSAVSNPASIESHLLAEKGQAFPMFHRSSRSWKNNLEGLVVYTNNSSSGYTQVFRTGLVEILGPVLTGQLEGRHQAPGFYFQGYDKLFFDMVLPTVAMLSELGVSPPLIVSYSFLGVSGIYLRYTGSFGIDEDDIQKIRGPNLILPQVLIEQFTDEKTMRRAFKPMFDALWDAAGLIGCAHYDANGDWVSPR